MAGVVKRRRLVNPRRRRNMTAKQIRYFGTARQRANLRTRNRRKRNVARPRYRRRNQLPIGGGLVSQAEHAASMAIRDVERAAEDAIHTVTGAVNRGRRNRRRNVGEILTVIPANPGRRRRRRNVAAVRRRRRNRATAYNPRRRRRMNRRSNRRHNPRTINVRRRRRYNVGRRNRRHNPRVVVRYRNRRMNRRNRGHRRRNPAWLQGDVGAVVGVLGGAAITGILTGFLPSGFQSGWGGYLATGVVAAVQGQVIGKVAKSSKLGNWMTVGGLLIVALKVVNDFFPQLNLPFALTGGGGGGAMAPVATSGGMGLITSSNFFVPQVNVPGSMATFVTPAGIPAPVVVPSGAKMSGLGYQGLRTLRRVGRMR